MAGTPDRSEEQKASGGPAPDDPRLAVARETPSASGVDQATAVFSVRDVAGASSGSAAEPEPEPGPEEPGDARLRAAVAAWVAGGAEGEGDADAAPKPDASGAAEDESDVESVESGDNGADGDAKSDVEPASGAESGASGEAEDEPVPGADGDADAEPKAAVDAEPKPAVDADAESGDNGADGGDAMSDAEPAAAAESGAAKADAKSDAEPEPESSPEASDAEPKPAAEAKPEAAVAPKADAEVTPGAESEPKPEADAEPKPAADAKSDAKPEAAVAPKADAEVTPGAEPESKPEADAEPKPAADAKPEAAVAPKADAEAALDAKSGAEPKADAKPEPDAKSEAKADAEPKPKPGVAVDQPTAVFKAVAPPVDQPTTMLKSPAAGGSGSGRKEESAAERTSRFVPLKPLDEGAGAGAGAGAGTGTAKPKPQTPAEPPAPERTTQQPLPPKPPLDLLAELTNTPPPAETRVRTAVRRVKIWTPLVLLLVVVFAIVQAVRPLPTPTLNLTAQQTVSFDGGKPSVPWPTQGQAAMDVNGIGTFGTSGDQKPVPIASIAKVMTVYVILRDHPLKTGEKGPLIPVDAAAQKHYETGKAENESVVKVTEGQKISEYEALQAVMLPSANNIAKLFARWDSGSSSEDEFVKKMNATAKELGMTNTTYTDPSGLDKTTVSTASDLVKLGRAAMENPVFKEISKQPKYVDLNGEEQKNFLGLVPTVAVGIKTGTTTAAGGNILFAAEKTVAGKTQTIIGAALGQYGSNGVANIDEVTGVVGRLIAAGQKALTAKTVVKKGDVVGEVDDGLGGTTPVVATKDVTAVGWSGLTVKLELGEQKGTPVPHSAKAGTVVGVLNVGDGKNDAVEVPVALQSDLAEPGFGAKIKRVG
ncbi:D-alanyl-D-alanine carboxypeptidase [Streptomyces longispororuber]|uniref:D-alanyl-D-alanine carboxypeptidase n=1 Tax=Streptomyces longispororuber TaxID=68230 RepID=UPI00210B9FCA|nr:D-alanyl-D-alanine carboxypeptidase [Streptomyces longispororuber]MCQ4209848.1 D-alanyl-D-alanine carboxypeptidase [Streptomyces longispororuber]